MFGISGGELVVLILVGLFVLGPERLPGAAAWLAKAVRQVREYASGAREQLRSELGPEFDELRQPLAELRQLRDFNPQSAITKRFFTDLDDVNPKPNGFAAQVQPVRNIQPLGKTERAPFDADAT